MNGEVFCPTCNAIIEPELIKGDGTATCWMCGRKFEAYTSSGIFI